MLPDDAESEDEEGAVEQGAVEAELDGVHAGALVVGARRGKKEGAWSRAPATKWSWRRATSHEGGAEAR